MTLDDFLASPFRADWRKLLENETLNEVLSTMEASAPVHDAPQQDISPTFANYALGFQQGYAFFSKKLRLLALPEIKPKQLLATYEPPK